MAAFLSSCCRMAVSVLCLFFAVPRPRFVCSVQHISKGQHKQQQNHRIEQTAAEATRVQKYLLMAKSS